MALLHLETLHLIPKKLENKMNHISLAYRHSIRVEGPFPIVRYTLASTKENHLKARRVISKKENKHYSFE